MYYDRFDIIDAHYWYCVDYHEGQFSHKYEKQCIISRYFKPSILANGPASENSQEIYKHLVKIEANQ